MYTSIVIYRWNYFYYYYYYITVERDWQRIKRRRWKVGIIMKFTVKYKRYSFTYMNYYYYFYYNKFIYTHSAPRHESLFILSIGMCESFLLFYTFCISPHNTNGRCMHIAPLPSLPAFDNHDHNT